MESRKRRWKEKKCKKANRKCSKEAIRKMRKKTTVSEKTLVKQKLPAHNNVSCQSEIDS